MTLFNPEIDDRLAALHSAVSDGLAIAFSRHGEFGHLPERVMVEISNGRRFVLALPMAAMAADQLEVNGFGSTAETLRALAA